MPDSTLTTFLLPAARAVMCPALVLWGFLGAAGIAAAATIDGVVTDDRGEPLERVPVCLSLASSPESCEKLRWTGRRGDYSFNGVKAGDDYRVRIHADRSAAARRAEAYKTYVWAPSEQAVAIDSRSAQATVETFVGKFNFSNFQRILSLTAADFPELSSLDLAGEYVALKVFIPANHPQDPPQTIYLGRVSSIDSLRIEASLPLAVDAISYEIYSATQSLSGTISLAGA